MLKVYGIHGRTSANLLVPAGRTGKAFLKVEFARGRIGAGPANRPATYATSDPVKQGIIEASPLYGKQIKLIRTHADANDLMPAAAPKQAAAKAAAAPAITEVPGVESYEEAVEYLKAHGAKATNLKSADAVKQYAKKIGVTFPNASF